ncbi:MAG: hypothetical protein LBJ20_06295 [Candidatus Methanoplasma sp.]|jgi:hypothetical protein|nr:hypothetical protein [Candidatus Methanoplasma sp.]
MVEGMPAAMAYPNGNAQDNPFAKGLIQRGKKMGICRLKAKYLMADASYDPFDTYALTWTELGMIPITRMKESSVYR